MILKLILLVVLSFAIAQRTEEISSLYVYDLPPHTTRNSFPQSIQYIPATKDWKKPHTHIIKTDGIDSVDIEAPFELDYPQEYLLRGQYKPSPKSVAFFNFEKLPGQQDVYVYNGTSDEHKVVYKQFSKKFEGTSYYVSDVVSSDNNTLVLLADPVQQTKYLYQIEPHGGYSLVAEGVTQVNYCQEEEFIYGNIIYNAATRIRQRFNQVTGLPMVINSTCYLVAGQQVYEILPATVSPIRRTSLIASNINGAILTPANNTNLHFTVLNSNGGATAYYKNGLTQNFDFRVDPQATASAVPVAVYVPYYNQTANPNSTFTYYFVHNTNSRWSLYRQNIGTERTLYNQFVAQLHPEDNNPLTQLVHNEIAYYAPLEKVLIVQIERKNVTHASKVQLIHVDVNDDVNSPKQVRRVDSLCSGECGLYAGARYMVQLRNGEVIVKKGNIVDGFRLHKVRWVEPRANLLVPILGGLAMALIAIVLIVGAIIIHIIVRRRDRKSQENTYEARPILTN
ncbi:hypothetical protein AKO1_007764 [Acrasis kona]|uniref:Uncharacterized protein n=1 Tax=Acrasis kona TaxID=1008807 RepID=A0AAW2YRS3_9EUKA